MVHENRKKNSRRQVEFRFLAEKNDVIRIFSRERIAKYRLRAPSTYGIGTAYPSLGGFRYARDRVG